MKTLEEMTAGELNKALDRCDKWRSRLCDEMIEAGRGHETPHDYMRKDDPLSNSIQRAEEQRRAIRYEMERRYGPECPHHLPTTGRVKFGPLKGPGRV
jgi:hypothetical protein